MSEEISLKETIAPTFYDVHNAINDKTHDEFWLKGGRGSCKSSTVAIEIVLGIVEDPLANCIAFRKVSRTIRDSIQGTFLWAIDQLGFTDDFESISSPSEITYKPTGQKIILRGLDEPRKLKSIKIRHGYFKFLWFEESDEFSSDEEIRSVEQSILRGGENSIEFFTFNPPRNPKHWINKMLKIEDKKKFIHHSTYRDVPALWLGSKFFEKAQRLEENNNEAFRHEYLGIPLGNPKEIIFYGHYEEREFETPALSELYQSRFYFGIDWGFADDPTAALRCFIKDDYLFVDMESGGKGIELQNLDKQVFNNIGINRNWPIYGDAARPDTIKYCQRHFNLNIRGAKKYKGSVEDGISYLKSFKKIIVHPRCKNLINEFDLYSYKIDKESREVLPVIVDKSNHWIDALRYALSEYIGSHGSVIGFSV